MMDEERVHVLSLEDDVGRVVSVEERELLAESGRARQRAHTFPCVRFVSILLRRCRETQLLLYPPFLP